MRMDGYKVTESTVVLLVVAVLYKIAHAGAVFQPLLFEFRLFARAGGGHLVLFLLGFF